MHPPPMRGCASLLSATRDSLSWRTMTARPLSSTPNTIALHCGQRKPLHRRLHSSNKRTTSDTFSTPTRSDKAGLSVPLLAGCQQARYFKKANYVEKIGDNERTEEILETLEENKNQQKPGSSRHVLSKDGQKPSVESQNQKWPEDMTKGENSDVFLKD